ncbi:MAG: SIMPL domain-containing protein [Chlorobium sp.]|uniref:SIMPL domain-containing protein n=1 Tax=Chlorobium sp. TaxID=1095 RepID=UPI0025BCA152|nr:SIMPL domain-containing protein [Chlorobium sp.]MCF8384007.1 SIMPL domain-containing protein [Chlorobium sp.]
MNTKRTTEAFILGAFLCAGLVLAGYLVSSGFVTLKALERSVSVKGLSEKEVPADIAIWPIKFEVAADDLGALVSGIEEKNRVVYDFLISSGFDAKDISISAPAIIDRQAQGYGDANRFTFRYAGSSTVSVYTGNVALVRKTIRKLVDLGKLGVAVSGENYDAKTEFLYTGLNRLKPSMIEQATNNARAVAEKFASDSKSRLGKIKSASQGQFTIEDRDSNTPYIKKVRVVSTLEYYLID